MCRMVNCEISLLDSSQVVSKLSNAAKEIIFEEEIFGLNEAFEVSEKLVFKSIFSWKSFQLKIVFKKCRVTCFMKLAGCDIFVALTCH